MINIFSCFLGLLFLAPSALPAQGKFLKPGFGLHLSPWVAPCHVPPKARSLQPQRQAPSKKLRNPLEFTPIDPKGSFAAIELRLQGRDPLGTPSSFSVLVMPGLAKGLNPPQDLPADFRALKYSSIRPPPAS